MKNFRIAFISNHELSDGMAAVSLFLNGSEKQNVNTLLWSNDGYKPIVSFAMAYTEDSILLKYFVTEKYVKADYHQINDPVYKDSCVEFFIAFGDDENYYNLEFNRIGTALIGYGLGKDDREILSESIISKIKSQHTITASADDKSNSEWELTLSIPFALFIHNTISSLAGIHCKANFFKCGDDLPLPHFLSWSAVDYPQPNFHLPRFFGTITFA
ncbi:carbohydrate-binding family 9-like protein [Mucilaginibacter sp.]